MDDALGQSSSESHMNDMIAALDAAEAAENPDVEAAQDPSADDGAEAVEQEEVEQPVFTVKVDGKEYTVTQDDLIAGYQTQAHATQQTQRNAEERRALEKEVETIKSRAAEVDKTHNAAIQRLTSAERILQANLGQPPAADLATRDPANYVAQRALYDQRVAAFRQVQSQLQGELQAKSDNDTKAHGQQMDAVWAGLVKSQPGWTDPAKAAAGTEELIRFVTGRGMSREELSKQASPAFWQMALEAQQLAKLQSTRAQLKDKKDRASPTARPGAATPAGAVDSQRQQKLVGNWKQTKSLKDAMAAAEHMNF